MNTITKTPLKGREANQLQFFWALARTMKDDHSLQKRMESIGIYWRFRGLLKQAENMCYQVFATMPEEQFERFDAALGFQKLQIVTRANAVDPTGDYMTVPRSAMVSVLQVASKECMLCDGSPNEMAKCQYRKAIKKLVLPDISGIEDDGLCMGRKLHWEDI